MLMHRTRGERTKGISQVQMDNASHRSDRILHAHHCELGNDFCAEFSRHALINFRWARL